MKLIDKSILLLMLIFFVNGFSQESFPAKVPESKPQQPLSAAMNRFYDQWNPHEDRGNELYSNFKYSKLNGFIYNSKKATLSRRDPSKVIKVNETYYVWYTKRETSMPPSGPQKANDTIPSADWDLCDIWYATSKDGFQWQERGIAVKRPKKGKYGYRSVSTPDILVWKNKYYLYFQGFNAIPLKNGDRAAATMAVANSPDGPWKSREKVVVDFGKEGSWDSNAIHDPYPLIYNNKIYLYYKGSPGKGGKDGTLLRAQGVAIANKPEGPFNKSPLNPVLNSGHETGLFPFKEGIAAIVSLDGPEKNTIQYAPDGINFEMASIVQMPPIAPGPFVPDAFANNKNGRGITWGLMHVDAFDENNKKYCKLVRFDCDLSLDVDYKDLKRNNLRHGEAVYFQNNIKLKPYQKNRALKNVNKLDHVNN